MILTSFLVVSVQELESQTSKTENVSSIYTSTFRVSFHCVHTHLQFSGADSERLVLTIKHFLEGKGAYFPGKGHR